MFYIFTSEIFQNKSNCFKADLNPESVQFLKLYSVEENNHSTLFISLFISSFCFCNFLPPNAPINKLMKQYQIIKIGKYHKD